MLGRFHASGDILATEALCFSGVSSRYYLEESRLGATHNNLLTTRRNEYLYSGRF